MAGTKDLHGAFSTNSFDSSDGSNFEICSGKGSLTWRRGSESAEATSTSQASAEGVVNTVAPTLPNEAAEVVSGQAAGVSPEAKISVAPAPHFRDAEDGAGAPVVSGDSGGDVCAVGQRCNGAPPGEGDGGSDGDTERLIQSLTCPAAAVRSALGSNCSGGAVAEAAQVPTAAPLALGDAPFVTTGILRGNSVSSVEAAITNMPESSSTSAEASGNVVERAYAVCEEYARHDEKRHATAVGGFTVEAAEDCVVEESTSGAHTEGTAESACDGSTGGVSDCCGCVGPIAETSVPDAAGVPPYLRIESLPALLEKEAGGRACVLLGQKKEALLYSVATPFGVNKCVLVCIYMLYAFLTGCVYFGWPSVSFMLLTSGAYSWRCPKDANGEFINDLRKRQNPSEGSGNGSGDDTAGGQGGKYYICDEQDAAVAPLFTIAYVTQSLMSVVAGTLLDHVSPKRAAMLGQLLNATGWVLLACSSYTFQAYIPAMVFIGLGADTAYLPTLLIAALFPGKRATVITLLGSANTASFAVPLLLELLWRVRPAWSFSWICWLYVGVGPLFCCCLAALFIPRTSFGSAALRKLPLQHQQSPLHGSKEDALLSAEEKEIKKRCGTRKGRRSSACCCSGFGTSQQEQEKKHCELLRHCTRVSCSSGVCECCCCTDADEAKARMNTASRGRQMLRRFVTSVLVCGCRLRLPQASRLLQRNQRVRLCFGAQPEKQSRTHVRMQQQQPRLYDLQRLEPEPSNNCGAVWPGDGVSCNQWRGSTEGDAAVADVSVEVESPAQERRTDEEFGTVAESSTAAFNVAGGTGVEAKMYRSTQSCLFGLRAAGQSNNGFKVHAEADLSTEQHEKRHCCIRMCATDGRGGTAPAGGGCCCACAEYRDTLTSITAQVQHSSFSAVLFPPSSSINKEAAENATSPQNCEIYVPSRLGAHADESREEEDGHGVEAVCAGAPAGLPELSSPAPSVEIEEKDEEEAEPSFCSQLLSSHFMCIVLYWSGMAVAISYFQSSSSRLFSTKALDFMDIALSFSFVPCVMLGKMIDLFGPFPALFLVNTMGVLAYCFALGGGSEQNVLQYVSIVAFCVYVSVDSEQVFCYVENTFNAKHFGKLSGLALTTGGVISLVSIPLYDEVTIRILKKNPMPVCCGLMVVLLVLYFTLGSMWFVRLKHPPAFKAKKKQMGTATAADPPGALESALTSAGCITTEAEEKEGEEPCAVDGDDTRTAAGVPSCVHRRHSQSCCCCCACAGGNGSSSTHRMTIRSDSYMWKRSEVVSTNGEDNSTRRHLAAAVKSLVKRLRDLFRGRRCRTVALQQQRGAERQQQERRGSSSGHGEDHLQAGVI